MKTIIALLAAALFYSASAVYTSNDPVVNLTPDNFDKFVHQSELVAAVEFYAPWCGHCKALAPHWKKVAQNLEGMAVVGAVDCDVEANKKLCASNEVSGFPTIKIFGTTRTKNPYTGAITKEAQIYWDARTAKPIQEAVMKAMTDRHITRLRTLDMYKEWKAANEGRAKVVLLTEKAETPALYKALSMQLNKGLDFGEVYMPAGKEVAEQLGVTDSFPVVLVIKSDGSTETYDGELKAPKLLKYLRAFSSEPSSGTEEGEGAKGSDPKGKKGGKADPSRDFVKNLTLAEVEALDAKEDMALIAFLAGESCNTTEAEFREAAIEMQEVVTTAVAPVTDADAEKLKKWGLDGKNMLADAKEGGCAMAVVLLPFGEAKDELDDYQVYEGDIAGKALQAWVTATMPQFATEITASNLQMFMTLKSSSDTRDDLDEYDVDDEEDMGHTPQPGRPLPPKVFLFTNKNECPGIYRALALNFRNKGPRGFGFGWVRADDEQNKVVIQNMKPTKIPGIMMVVPMLDKTKPDGRTYGMSGQPYPGPIKYSTISQWIEVMIHMMESMHGKTDAGPMDLPELKSDADLKKHCVDKGAGVCVIGLLDSASSVNTAALKALRVVAGKREGEPLHFSTVDARKYRRFLTSLNVLSSDAPTAVALSATRMRYAVLPEKLGEQGSAKAIESTLSSFIDGVLGGRVRTTHLQELPKVAEGEGAASDSADSGQCTMPPPGAKPSGDCGGASDTPTAGSSAESDVPVEDEFDLSEIMGEEVEGTLSKEARMKQVEEELQAEEAAKKEAAAAKKKKKKSKKSKKSKKASDAEL